MTPAGMPLPPEAELVIGETEVRDALDRMAADINRVYRDRDPLVVGVMLGGLVPMTWLLQRFDFPHRIDYVHATRYRGDTTGRDLQWIASPREPVAGQEVLIIDDIFDEGITLKAIVGALAGAGARSVRTAVLVDKRHRRKVGGFEVDFVGLEVDDRYVFGCGMDYRGYYRNLTAIYALREAGDA